MIYVRVVALHISSNKSSNNINKTLIITFFVSGSISGAGSNEIAVVLIGKVYFSKPNYK